jgi:hypothetical protein
MSELYMNIYHGRTDPEQSMEDWGTPGPVFYHMDRVQYRNGSLSLHYQCEAQQMEASRLTGWLPVSSEAFKDADHFIVVPFHHQDNAVKPLVGCWDSGLKTLTWCSDFFIRHRDPHGTMNMRLEMDAKYASRFPDDMCELVLDEVAALHFTYGAYRVWFESSQACRQAMVMTGWEAGIDPDISLDMPLVPDGNAVLVSHPALYGNVPVSCNCFTLVPN